MRRTAPLVATALTLIAGCRTDAPQPRAAASPSAAAATTSGRPSAEDRVLAAAELEPAEVLTGKVLETMDAGGYTYLHLDTARGPVWAAVDQAKVRTGAGMSVLVSVRMEGFESRALGRRFDQIAFGTLHGTNTAPDHGAADASPHGSPHGAPHPPASAQRDAGPIKVARAGAPEGRTVAEVFAQRAELDGRTVAVRGKVVKFLPGILGRNWLHIQDGTGSAGRRDHDLTVTTSDMASVGDVVIARGTARKDLDFGSGYAYGVLVEQARLSR
jgi:hypothetical protein